ALYDSCHGVSSTVWFVGIHNRLKLGARRSPQGREMKVRSMAFALAAVLAGISAAAAQGYPSRPVTMVVPFAAGGPVDTIARIVGTPMAKTLGQTIVVENVVGASGTLGVGRVARAAPDGYTLSIGHWGTHVINGAVYPLQYDLLRDLQPLAMIASNPLMIVANASFPARDLKELIGWLKANPGKASAGTAGSGSATHIGGIYFQNATGTRFELVPYKGSGPAMLDLVGGRIELMIDQASNSIPQLRGGKIKAYAITAKTRLAAAPEIPTVDEAGLPGLHVSVRYGIRLHLEELRRALAAEILNYPTPIPRCDAQFNHLYEQQARLTRDLDRVGAIAGKSLKREDCIDLIERFVASAPYTDDDGE